MKYICHRINTVTQLKKVPKQYGIEIDLRDGLDGEIHMSHDPFVKGERFEDYVEYYDHDMLILNIKSERIEWKILEILRRKGIRNYFFLDCTFPMISALIKSGEDNIAIRLSEFESIENARLLRGKANWIWVDCFSRLPINGKEAGLLKEWGYKLCLVSPELQGRPEEIISYKKQIIDIGFDAICTKQQYLEQWMN